MIDCDATFNFIFQMKIKKWNLQKIVDVSSKLKTLNDFFFKCYEAHILRTKIIDSSKQKIRIKQTIIVANMTKIHMILNFFWLKKLNSDIDWFFVIIRWRIENAKKISKENSCYDRRDWYENYRRIVDEKRCAEQVINRKWYEFAKFKYNNN
jgi:hypothetical protein